MKLVENIPPDAIVEMTEPMMRAFLALNCDPQCHSCLKPIHVGRKFKLAFIGETDTDEMLCYHCTPAILKANQAERQRKHEAWRRHMTGGFTREHQR